MEMSVQHVEDFEVTGKGSAPVWEQAAWHPLTPVGPGPGSYATRTKVLWSRSGVYFLVDCEDMLLTCTMTRDFEDIYNEDVVEVFLWPDERQELYFEYEISPLGVELPILIPNHQGRFMGWRPWHYEGQRLIRRATTVRGGHKAPLARVEGWTAEFFFPFELFTGLGNMPPQSGTRWRGNIYRIDYDAPQPVHWAWCPDTGADFHDFRQFGTLRFL